MKIVFEQMTRLCVGCLRATGTPSRQSMSTCSAVRAPLFFLVAVMGFALSGCGSAETGGPAAPTTSAEPATAVDFAQRDWCAEHGVPESQCGRCSAKLAATFQKEGDWCKEHNRPESQCFICRPKAATKFAAVYEARFGKAPPKPSE
jgi:hypothetical protein